MTTKIIEQCSIEWNKEKQRTARENANAFTHEMERKEGANYGKDQIECGTLQRMLPVCGELPTRRTPHLQ